MSFTYEYPRPSYAADVIVLYPGNNGMEILLIKRGNYPFKDFYAIPGGFIDMDENSHHAALRELEEETSIKAESIYFFDFKDNPGRDPRGRTLTKIYITMVDSKEAKAGDDAKEVRWFNLDDIPNLAFDHGIVIEDIKKFIKNGPNLNGLDRFHEKIKTK
jgi:8-oxo-dGTP diphosphatase